MKKRGTAARWFFAVWFALFALVNGFHWTSLLLLISAVVMAPISFLKDFFEKRKIPNAFVVTASVIMLMVACVNAPMSKTDSTPPKETTIASVENEEKEVSKTDKKDDKDKADKEDKKDEEAFGTVKAEISQEPVGTGKAETLTVSGIPTYSGNSFVILNDNVPNFSAAELKTSGYEKYGELDSLGRCTVAIASVGKDTMPPLGAERGNISSIKPTGWVQAKYDNVSGKYLYNRCHLIGWQLSAENANRQNLITGTRYFNTEGMLPFENMVADYIKETGNHVAYRITPIYEGNNLLCNGVQIEAYSVEDKGEGIQFNVFCYNVQPDITIDYATGKSQSNVKHETSNSSSSNNSSGTTSSSGGSSTSGGGTSSGGGSTTQTQTPAPTPTPTPTPSGEMVWIPTRGGQKYHNKSSCSGMIEPEYVTIQEAQNRGFTACKKCY